MESNMEMNMDSKMGYDSTESKDLESLESDIECSICFVNEKNKILPCGHKVCEKCYQQIELCPFCRNKLNKPIVSTNESVESVESVESIESLVCVSWNTRYYIFMTILASIGPITWFSYGIILFRNK